MKADNSRVGINWNPPPRHNSTDAPKQHSTTPNRRGPSRRSESPHLRNPQETKKKLNQLLGVPNTPERPSKAVDKAVDKTFGSKPPRSQNTRVPSGYVSHDDYSHRHNYNSSDEFSGPILGGGDRGYNSDTIATQTSPERLSLQSNTKSWRNANSPSVDKGVVAYGSALANWGIGAKPKHNIKKVGRNRKKKNQPPIDWRGQQVNKAEPGIESVVFNGVAKHPDVRKYKTSMCSHFTKSGTCGFGESCIFAHGEHELKEGRPKMRRNSRTKQQQQQQQMAQQQQQMAQQQQQSSGIRSRNTPPSQYPPPPRHEVTPTYGPISAPMNSSSMTPPNMSIGASSFASSQLSPEQRSIWMPPQPELPLPAVGMSSGGTPNSEASDENERVGILENEVKQLRKALFLQQKKKKKQWWWWW